jgi:hypothetical protein
MNMRQYVPLKLDTHIYVVSESQVLRVLKIKWFMIIFEIKRMKVAGGSTRLCN